MSKLIKIDKEYADLGTSQKIRFVIATARNEAGSNPERATNDESLDIIYMIYII
jgi:hypothetical protein